MRAREREEEDEVLCAMRRKGRRAVRLNIALQLITIATALASLVLYFTQDERGADITVNHIAQCVCALVVFNVPLVISRRFRCYIPDFLTVTLCLFTFAHFVIGEIYRAYDKLFLYDKILHTTGGVIFALLSFSVVWLLNNAEGRKTKLSPFFVVLFTFCFTMTVEYVWELVEFSADRLFGLNMQRWQDSIIPGAEIVVDGEIVQGTAHSLAYGNGLFDTMSDMAVNIAGCLVVCIFAYIGMKRRPDWFENKVILTEGQFCAMLAEKKAQAKTAPREAEGEEERETSQDTEEES